MSGESRSETRREVHNALKADGAPCRLRLGDTIREGRREQLFQTHQELGGPPFTKDPYGRNRIENDCGSGKLRQYLQNSRLKFVSVTQVV